MLTKRAAQDGPSRRDFLRTGVATVAPATVADRSSEMRAFALVALSAVLLATTARAQVPSFPANFKTRTISTRGAQIFVRVGGQGPAVVLLHGYGETGDIWAPLAARLARGHTVIVPDLRGMGLSSHPAGGYDKKAQAGDVAAVLDTLKIDKVDLVTHDIGNMVGYAFAAGQRSEEHTSELQSLAYLVCRLL